MNIHEGTYTAEQIDRAVSKIYRPVIELANAPTASTLTYINLFNETLNFCIGDEVRVLTSSGYRFYKLYDIVISGNTSTAVWEEVVRYKDILFTGWETHYIINQKEIAENEYRSPSEMIEGHTASMYATDREVVNGKYEYIDVISRIRDNSHIYVGQYDTVNDKLLIKQVDDNDKTKYADGSTITLGAEQDVFMKLPHFWWKCEEIEADKYKVRFTMSDGHIDDTWHEWTGNGFIGVYKGVVVNNKLYSKPGVTPTASISWINFTAYARARYNNNKYRLLTYEAHNIMCLLGWGWLGTTDEQGVVGVGTDTNKKTTGLADSKGMNDSKASVDGNSTSINFWGLENYWGDLSELLDNVVTTSNFNLNILGDDRTSVKRTIVTGLQGNDGEIKKMVLGAHGDVVPKLIVENTSYDKCYATAGYIYDSAGGYVRASGTGNSRFGGLCYFSAGAGAEAVNQNVGCRLFYEGTYEIVNNF